MSALDTFQFSGMTVRTITIDDELWFVAMDAAGILGYSATSAMTRTLDDDEKGVHNLHTPGGDQEVTIVSEAGLFSAILRSRSSSAHAFKRWVTHEVLPTIRRTGSYAVESPEQLMARAVIQAQELLARRDQQVAELAPRAEAWDELASADGDYSVADAAKMLARAGVKTGPQRLFDQLAGIRWTHRAHDGKWRAYASAVDNGYLTEKPQSHRHPRTDEVILDAPQVRVTVHGLERLRQRLGSIDTGAAA